MSGRSLPLFVVLLVLGCAPTPPAELQARRFMEAYYQTADLKSAAELADGVALEKVQSSLKLIEGYPLSGSTRRPEVRLKLVRGESTGERGEYLFRVSVTPSDFATLEKLTRVKVRRRDVGWKVTQFSEEDRSVP